MLTDSRQEFTRGLVILYTLDYISSSNTSRKRSDDSIEAIMYDLNGGMKAGTGVFLFCALLALCFLSLKVPFSSLRQNFIKTELDSTNSNLESMYRVLKPNSLATSVNYFHRQDIRMSCVLKNFSPLPLPVTALASIPGSGNTWSRQVIELITGT